MEIRLTEKVPAQSEVEKEIIEIKKLITLGDNDFEAFIERIATRHIREKSIAVLEAVIKELDEYGENTGNVCRIISHYQSRLVEMSKEKV